MLRVYIPTRHFLTNGKYYGLDTRKVTQNIGITFNNNLIMIVKNWPIFIQDWDFHPQLSSEYARILQMITNQEIAFDSGSGDSDTDEPTWPTTVGDLVTDGDVIWQCEELEGTPDSWVTATTYDANDLVAPTTPNTFMYRAIEFTYKTVTEMTTIFKTYYQEL